MHICALLVLPDLDNHCQVSKPGTERGGQTFDESVYRTALNFSLDAKQAQLANHIQPALGFLAQTLDMVFESLNRFQVI